MAAQSSRLDLHTALKACYFADKTHLNEYQQPIFGARYRAMAYGPVPLEIYELIKGESLWLAELGRERMPWRLDGFRIVAESNEPMALDRFAESELEHFVAGFELSQAMTFTQRTAATHGPDWHAANGGEMRYEDMIEDRPDRDAMLAFIRETARRVRL
ncbi:MAG: Panacea domain-containing protein [Gemmobacter sp.]